MTTAEEKRDQHIVEYILYVWQMEDLVRAVNLDLAALRTHLSSAYQGDRLEAELMWFGDLIQTLKREKKTAKGHVGALDEVMIELTYLHRTLMDVLKDEEYKSAVEAAKPHLDEMPNGASPRALKWRRCWWPCTDGWSCEWEAKPFLPTPRRVWVSFGTGPIFWETGSSGCGPENSDQLAFFLFLVKEAVMDFVLFF